jgi:hypothetical protein
LQTPSGKNPLLAGRGLQPRPSRFKAYRTAENVSDGVANPVRQNIKKQTFRTGLQIQSGTERDLAVSGNPLRSFPETTDNDLRGIGLPAGLIWGLNLMALTLRIGS